MSECAICLEECGPAERGWRAGRFRLVEFLKGEKKGHFSSEALALWGKASPCGGLSGRPWSFLHFVRDFDRSGSAGGFAAGVLPCARPTPLSRRPLSRPLSAGGCREQLRCGLGSAPATRQVTNAMGILRRQTGGETAGATTRANFRRSPQPRRFRRSRCPTPKATTIPTPR